jgi:hypothetical protein
LDFWIDNIPSGNPAPWIESFETDAIICRDNGLEIGLRNFARHQGDQIGRIFDFWVIVS